MYNQRHSDARAELLFANLTHCFFEVLVAIAVGVAVV